MKKKLSFVCWAMALIVLSGIHSNAEAQQTTVLYGSVYDSRSGQPIEGVTLVIEELNKSVFTLESGDYKFVSIPTGRYTINLSHVNFDKISKPISLDAGKEKYVDFYMDPITHQLKGVIIKETYVRDIPYMKHVLTKQDVELQASHDIGAQLRMLPNVGGIKKGGINIDPVVRGFKYSQISVMIDKNIQIEGGCPNRMDPTTSHIALDNVEEIEVLKGPFALRYGNVFGGVVNMVPVKPVPYESFEVHAKGIKGYESNWNGTREYLAVNGGNKNIYFLLSGHNQQYGDYTAGNGERFNTNFHKFGYSAKIGIRPWENHELMLSYTSGMSKGIMFAALPMDDRKDDSEVMSVDYKIGKINDIVNSIDIKAFKSAVDHTMDNKSRRFSDTVAAVSHIIADAIGARAEAGLTIFDAHFYVGMDYKLINKDGDRTKNMIGQYPVNGNVPVKIEKLWTNAEINNVGLFMEYKKKIKAVDIIAAVRFDMNSAISDKIILTGMGSPPPVLMEIEDTESEYSALSFSAGTTYNFNEKWAVSLSAGRGTRFPDMTERFIIALPVGFDNFEYIGNPKLKPEVNNEIDLNMRYESSLWGGVDVTVFYSLVEQYIMGKRIPPATQKPLTNSVYGVKKFENFDKATFMGFELAYKTPEKYRFGAALVASYTQGVIDETLKPIIDPAQPPAQAVIGEETINNDPAPEIPPFDATVNIKYKMLEGRFVPSLSYRFVAKQNKISDAYGEEETPSFSLLGLNMVYHYNRNLTLSGGVNNIFDIAYYEHLNRRVIGTNANFYEPGRIFYINLVLSI